MTDPRVEAIRSALTDLRYEPINQPGLVVKAHAALDSLAAECAPLQEENATLRGLVAQTVRPCHYCGAETMSKCPYGFPGCSLADDLMLSDEVMSGDILKRFRAAEARVETLEAMPRVECVARDKDGKLLPTVILLGGDREAVAAVTQLKDDAKAAKVRVKALTEGLRALIRVAAYYFDNGRGDLDGHIDAARRLLEAEPPPSEET